MQSPLPSPRARSATLVPPSPSTEVIDPISSLSIHTPTKRRRGRPPKSSRDSSVERVDDVPADAVRRRIDFEAGRYCITIIIYQYITHY